MRCNVCSLKIFHPEEMFSLSWVANKDTVDGNSQGCTTLTVNNCFMLE